ncbi:MAG: TetR family transcriptional regulator [Sphingomonas bacterium]|nr:TetR family transcriptional regulator [Sphingomonas bacterium]MDB5717920.1 TetR family transcriptional regulator [Sphingomonas bacterium]
MTKTSRTTRPGARDRAIKEAEGLFIQHGYDGTSLRDIANTAEVNLGSLVYHFATKEGLFRAICDARLLPVIDLQTEQLAACELRLAAGETLSLDDLFRTVFGPALRSSNLSGDLAGLYALVFTDPSETVRVIGKDLFGESSQRMYRLARRLSPGLDEAEFFWRYVGIVGSVTIIQGFAGRLSYVLDVPQPEVSVDRLIDTTIGIIVRGLEGTSPTG